MKRNQTLQKVGYKSRVFLKNNSSTILTFVGAVGVVVTAVTAVKATPKALKLLEKATDEKGEELTKLEAVKVAGPAYIPSVVIGASTIGCIFGANILNKHQQAAITSAYALVDNSYKEYRNKLKELFGEETDTQIRDAIVKDHCKEDNMVYAPGIGPLDTSGEKRLFYEEHRGAYFESTLEAVQAAEYHFNRNFTMRGYANLNEFYEFLGLDPTEKGNELGWNSWELLEGGWAAWIDFDHRMVTLEDGLECCVIDFTIEPNANYEEF